MPHTEKPARWWSKRQTKAQTADLPPVSCSQPHNNPPEPDQGQAPAQPAAEPFQAQLKAASQQRRQQEYIGPANHHIHSVRADAFKVLGIPDIAPPHPMQQKEIRKRAEETRQKILREKIQYTPGPDQHAQTIPGATPDHPAFTVAALPPPPPRDGNINDHTIEEFIELVERGYIQSEIARLWRVPNYDLWEWTRKDEGIFARVTAAFAVLAEACDSKAYQLLADCKGKTGPEVAKAAAMARFLQWRASKYSARYADKSEVVHSGSLTVEHVTPDRPPITDLVAQCLKPFAPPPSLIDVPEDSQD